MNELIAFAESLMQKDLARLLNDDLKNIRSNQVSPELIGNLSISHQGQKKRIKDLTSSLFANSNRELVIRLIDPKNEPTVIKTILDAGLGYQLGKSEDKEIYLSLSPMNETIRKDLFKKVEQIIEEGKKNLRLSRQKIRDLIKKKGLSQNEQKSAENEVEKLSKKYLDEMEKIKLKKKKELFSF